MTAIVAGIYKEGKIELLEAPTGLREGRVRVVLIEEENPRGSSRYLTFGKYQSGPMSSLDDFKDAEWQGEADFEERHGQ